MNHNETELAMFSTSLSGATNRASDEVLVTDDRGGASPAQIVERKLVSILQGGELRVSQLQSQRLRYPSA